MPMPEYGSPGYQEPEYGMPGYEDPGAIAGPGAPAAGVMGGGTKKPMGKSGTPEQELARLMIGQAPYGQRERDLAGQMQMAEELRKTATPGMRGNSRIQVAANPLEHINTALSRGYGAMQRGNIEDQQRQMFQERLDNLRKGMGGGAPGLTEGVDINVPMSQWG